MVNDIIYKGKHENIMKHSMKCHILFKQHDLHTIHEHVTPPHICSILLKSIRDCA